MILSEQNMRDYDKQLREGTTADEAIKQNWLTIQEYLSAEFERRQFAMQALRVKSAYKDDLTNRAFIERLKYYNDSANKASNLCSALAKKLNAAANKLTPSERKIFHSTIDELLRKQEKLSDFSEILTRR